MHLFSISYTEIKSWELIRNWHCEFNFQCHPKRHYICRKTDIDMVIVLWLISFTNPYIRLLTWRAIDRTRHDRLSRTLELLPCLCLVGRSISWNNTRIALNRSWCCPLFLSWCCTHVFACLKWNWQNYLKLQGHVIILYYIY